MTGEPREWQERADELAAEAVRAGEPTAWFDRLYAEGHAGTTTLAWDRQMANPLLGQWMQGRGEAPDGARAVVVGAGLGADAAYLADLGYDTLAFDVSPTAVEIASSRVSAPNLRFEAADLLDLPAEWHRAFDLVVEIYTVQALPRALRAQAAAAVGDLVAPGGTLLAIQAELGAGDDPAEGPPWAFTRAEIESFAGGSLEPVRVESVPVDGPFSTLWLAELTRRDEPGPRSGAEPRERVRDAEPGDAGRIAEMVRELATYEKEVDQVESTAASFARLMFPTDGTVPMAFCLIAEVRTPDGRWQAVGFAAWYVTFSTWTGENGIWLEDLYVSPDHRGSGLGKALLARLAAIALERGYKRVEWWVLTWNEPALGFYRRLGAEALNEWVHYRIDRAALQELGAPPAPPDRQG